MKRKFLEDMGLEKEAVDKIMAENGRDIAESKGDYENIKAELENARATISERDRQLAGLKDSAKDNEELTNKIAELEKQNKDVAASYKKELDNLKISNAIDKALSEARAKTPRAVKAMLDMEGIKLDKDGTVTGISEQLKKLTEAEDTKYLFEGEQQFRGAAIGNSDPTPDGEDTSKMTYSEMCAYFEKNPNAKL